MRVVLLASCVLGLLVGFWVMSRTSRPDGVLPRDAVVLLGIDGLDRAYLAELIDQGLLPNFARLQREGITLDLEVESPPLSPRIWTSIASGYSPEIHGVGGWSMDLGAMSGAELYTARHVRADRVWDVASDDGQEVFVAGWLMTTPVNEVNGRMIADELVFRIPMDTSLEMADPGDQFQSASFLTHPDDIGGSVRELVPDDGWLTEHPLVGYQVQQFEVSQHPLRRDETNLRAFEQAVDELGPRFSAVLLGGVDQVSHLFWAFVDSGSIQLMRRDRMAWKRAALLEHQVVPDKRFRPYGGMPTSDTVVAEGAMWVRDYYRYADHALGRVMARIDPADSTLVVCSDHGFRVVDAPAPLTSDHDTPAVLMAWGNLVGVSAGVSSIHSYDLAPTLYAMLGLPAAMDMPGHVRTDVFDVRTLEPIETRTRSESRAQSVAVSFSSRTKMLEELGYIDAEGKPLEWANTWLLRDLRQRIENGEFPALEEALDIPWDQDVQIDRPGKVELFRAWLEARDVGSTEEEVRVSDLRPIHQDFNLVLVQQMIRGSHAETTPEAAIESMKAEALLITQDGYVMTHHHRWLGLLLNDPSHSMKVVRFEMDVPTFLEQGKTFLDTQVSMSQGKLVYLDGDVAAGDAQRAGAELAKGEQPTLYWFHQQKLETEARLAELENLTGVSASQMPRVESEAMPAFFTWLAQRGIGGSDMR
ncbi:MAG: alkaline phosphatase family protein, partial [Myxococcota bacterium]|nr:alkaline phosphatase family protein [Myxococcota bacterium]